MSDDSIRLELSQERLRRELAKGPANYRAIARAELEVRRSEQALRGENQRLERQFDETRRSADRMSRGMLAGSGALRGLGRNLSFASAGFLGGAGLVYGMRRAIDAASNLEEQQNKVRVVFEDSAPALLAWSQTTATSIGIASDEALSAAGSIGNMVVAMGLGEDKAADMSKELVTLAADMASFNNEDPSDMLERIRSGLAGEMEPLRRFGSVLSAARVNQFAWSHGIAESGEQLTEQQKILARYGLLLQDTAKQQGDFARTSDGLANSQRTLSALWREANILVGQALAPTYAAAVEGIKDWLSVEENRRDLQREVNQVVKDGEQVIHGLYDALKLVKEISEPVVDALGGVGNTIEAITLLWVAMKVKAILGFGGTAAASKAASISMIADARAVDVAWTTATRPRVMPVAVAPIGGPGGAAGAGKWLGRLGKFGAGLAAASALRNPALITAAAVLASSGAAGAKTGDRVDQRRRLLNGDYAKRFPHLTNAAFFVTNGQGTEAQKRAIRSIWNDTDDSGYAAAERMLIKAEGEYGPGPHRTAPPPTKDSSGDKGGTGPGSFTYKQFQSQAAAIQERALDAAATPGESDDVREAKAELALIRRALKELELTRDQRVALKQRRNALLSQIASVEQQADQEAQAKKDKAAADRKDRADKAKAAIRTRIDRRERALTVAAEVAADTERDLTDDKAALIRLRRFYGEQAQNDKLTLDERQAYADKRRDVRRKLRDLYKKAVDDAIDDDKITKREAARLRALGGEDLVRRARRAAGRKSKGADDEDKPLTAAEINRMLYDFASGLHGVLGQFGSNVGDSAADYGITATHAEIQTLELRKQTQILADFTGAVRHPMTGYHKTEGTTTLLGVGF